MIRHYQIRANAGIITGLVLNIGSRIAGYYLFEPGRTTHTPMVSVVIAASAVGTIAFIYGCVMYALAKGRSGWWGAFGLLNLIGLIVLICLTDYARDGFAPQQRGFEPTMREPIARDADTNPPPPPTFRG